MYSELILEQKDTKGEDGYKTISLRIKEKNVEKLDELINITNQSRNALINKFIEFGLDNYKIVKKE